MATYRESACMNHNRFSFDITYLLGIYCALHRQSIQHRDLLVLISPHITPVAEVYVAPIHITTNDGAVQCCRDGWLDF